ncbi:MAG: efflux RND transporter periplasmic adaptor subunit [Planctomycetes bacterium]|nr:efflux RND transporter periplasmic adaptor subunit [Planctomycetota bacterium]
MKKVLKSAAWTLVALVVAAGVCFRLLAPARVGAVTPQRGLVVEEVFGTGTLEAKVVVAVSTKITGKVTTVLVDQGDTVTNGQVVARLEATDYEHSVRVAEAALGQAQAELAKAKLDLARNRDLLRDHTISQAEFDTADTSYRVAEAKIKSAEANLGFARARLADTVIHSPVAGLALVRNLEVGDTVVPGTPIFRVADTQVLWVQAMVDEREAGKLGVGQPARITFRADHGRSFPGRLVRLAREADRVTEEREADVIVDHLPRDWFIGAKANVYIETARRADALQLPASAIVRRGDQPGVFVVNSGRAHWRPVRLGLTGRDTVELAGGVEAREVVIANPFAGKKPVADGQRVAAPGAKEQPCDHP